MFFPPNLRHTSIYQYIKRVFYDKIIYRLLIGAKTGHDKLFKKLHKESSGTWETLGFSRFLQHKTF